MFFRALLLTAALEVGFLSGSIWNYSERNNDWVDVGVLYADIETSVHYKNLYVGGSVNCYFTPQEGLNFSPFQATFIFNAGVDFNNFKLGYEHSCFHPMQTYATVFGNEIKPKYEGGYNKFFVRIETK